MPGNDLEHVGLLSIVSPKIHLLLRTDFDILRDPVAFVKPWTVTKTYKRAPPDFKLMPYVCLENNRNPLGPDGAIRVILQSGDSASH